MAQKLMIQGTMSGAGKSILTAGILRVLREDGYRVAPFKSQNMALNSYITAEGEEMGRAQVVQAAAAGMRPVADMNPILLKPMGDTTSQVIVNGRSIGNMRAKEYFAMKRDLIPDILAAFRRLEEEADIIVIEGAGSPAEINLRRDDIVNMGLAELVDAPVLLAGNIDPGGVFAQLLGTVSLLSPKERARVRGLIINKFRGDARLLLPGLDLFRNYCEIPFAGIVPYVPLRLEEEDSLSSRLEQSGRKQNGPALDIAVIRLPYMSNYSDFTALETLPGVALRYVSEAKELETPDLMILPGTKNTIGDLLTIRKTGMEAAILAAVRRKVPLIGICGGYQMLGLTVSDPTGAEHEGEVEGMGLLPVVTVFGKEKRTTQSEGRIRELTGFYAPLSGCTLSGYEIHMGRTEVTAEGAKLADTDDGRSADGAVRGRVLGTYMHGFFDNPSLLSAVLRAVCAECGKPVPDVEESPAALQERELSKLARTLREALDWKLIREVIGIE